MHKSEIGWLRLPSASEDVLSSLKGKMPVFLKGLGLQFYRGIGPDIQRMHPFKEFNFFIGANNSGKSTVLNFISDNFPISEEFIATNNNKTNQLDVYRGKITGERRVELSVTVDQFVSSIVSKYKSNRNLDDYIRRIGVGLSDGNDVIWLKVNTGTGNVPYSFAKTNELDQWQKILPSGGWYDLFQVITNQSQGSFGQHWVPECLAVFQRAQSLKVPEVHLVPALRQIGRAGSDFKDFSGAGLIDRLAQIQSPDHDQRHERELFNRVNSFLREVVGKSDAEIEVPHNREHVIVHMDNKVLPLSSLGMGIHQVIMIAAFCTLVEKKIVCIEEPEIHLHPLLQRKLITYLRDMTDNQYFIATHSASFIDTPGSAIFHVSNDGSQTFIRESILRSDRHNICVDLGYKASDIVQANAIIWVEGPSDRIYIKYWISSLDPSLIEGIHFSIMFYGGRLLSHLSAESDDIDAFISLRSLNQNLALVMDSDKPTANSHVNATKKRLQTEFMKGRGVCWITKGREIENYVDHAVLQSCVKELYSNLYDSCLDGGAYDHALYFRRTKKKSRNKESITGESDFTETDVDKVSVAKLVADREPNLDILDLRDRILEIIAMIKRAN